MEGFEEGLVEWYRLQILKEDGFIHKTGQDQKQIYENGLNLIYNLFNAIPKKVEDKSKNNIIYDAVSFLCKKSKINIVSFLSNELFFNTYYMLKQFLEKNISNNGIENNMFVFMNIITYLQLIDEIVIKEKRFLHLTNEFRETIKSLDLFINSIAESSTQKPRHLDYISKMLNHLKKLC